MSPPAPVTLFAPGGAGDDLDRRMRWVAGVPGTTVGFVYGQTGADVSAIRREADRDAAEVCAVAASNGATQAVGFSRGARAVVGALAGRGVGFDRIALVIPPAGAAAGAWSAWLDSRPRVDATVLVIGHRGDPGHPARVASAWADLLGARLELLPARAVTTEVDLVAGMLAEFFA